MNRNLFIWGIVLTCVGVLGIFTSYEVDSLRCVLIPAILLLASGLICLALFLISIGKQPKR